MENSGLPSFIEVVLTCYLPQENGIAQVEMYRLGLSLIGFLNAKDGSKALYYLINLHEFRC